MNGGGEQLGLALGPYSDRRLFSEHFLAEVLPTLPEYVGLDLGAFPGVLARLWTDEHQSLSVEIGGDLEVADGRSDAELCRVMSAQALRVDVCPPSVMVHLSALPASELLLVLAQVLPRGRSLRQLFLARQPHPVAVPDVWEQHDRGYPPRARFTVAHELGHHLLRHHSRFHVDLATLPSEGPGDHLFDPRLEREANDFAANLLMPATLVRIAYSPGAPARSLAAQFEVSPLAMSYRLVNLGLKDPI